MINFGKLPEGWVLTNLGDVVITIQYGYTASSTEQQIGPKFLRITDLQNNLVDWKTVPFCDCDDIEKYKLKKGDIVIARTGATTGKSFLLNEIPEPAIFASYLIRLNTSQIFPPEYIALFMQSVNYWNQITAVSKGSAQPGANASILSKLFVPLAPLNEQRRIVAKIEALKARSQRVKDALEDIPQLLDQFRQSVLAAAFRGDLTADWRQQNPDAAEWETTTLQKVIKSKPRNGYSPKPVDYVTKVKSITLSATTSGIFKPEYFKYIDEDIASDSYLWLNPGDILIQRSNTLEYVGVCAIYEGDIGKFIYPDLIMKIQVMPEKATHQFIYYALSNQATRSYFKRNATGTAGNMPKINQQVVMNTPITLPCIAEQKEIVYRIKSFFRVINTIKQQYQETKANLDQLDQSILAKAFRGELVPQDPNDEAASVLLERIRTERTKLETKTAKKPTAKTSYRRTKKAQAQTEESVQLELGLE